MLFWWCTGYSQRSTFFINELGVTSLLFSPVYVICKQGNDSQKAVQVMEKMMGGSEVDIVTIKDICGGLMAWAKKIDPTFPQY